MPDHQIGSGCRSAAARTAGTRITYTNVVRRWIKLGDWTGKAETSTCRSRTSRPAGIDSAAVVVQSGVASAPKLMLGAAQIALQ